MLCLLKLLLFIVVRFLRLYRFGFLNFCRMGGMFVMCIDMSEFVFLFLFEMECIKVVSWLLCGIFVEGLVDLVIGVISDDDNKLLKFYGSY